MFSVGIMKPCLLKVMFVCNYATTAITFCSKRNHVIATIGCDTTSFLNEVLHGWSRSRVFNVQDRQTSDPCLRPEFCVRLGLGNKSTLVRFRERSCFALSFNTDVYEVISGFYSIESAHNLTLTSTQLRVDSLNPTIKKHY